MFFSGIILCTFVISIATAFSSKTLQCNLKVSVSIWNPFSFNYLSILITGMPLRSVYMITKYTNYLLRINHIQFSAAICVVLEILHK